MFRLSINNYFLIIALFISFSAFSQMSDIDLIIQKDSTKEEYKNIRKVTYLFKDKNAFIKYNPLSLFFGGALYIYQKYISIQIGANCPYEISCSTFSKLCIQKYGLLYGIPLTSDRLTRCTRLASFDLIRGVEYNARTNKIYDNLEIYSFKPCVK